MRFTPGLGLHGSPVIPHASDMNPSDYALASHRDCLKRCKNYKCFYSNDSSKDKGNRKQ